MAKEFEFIRKIRAASPAIGDDCAVWLPQPGYEQLVSTDLLIEGVHFTLSHGTLEQLGSRALAVNLSDIAAMGGAPRHATLGLALPAGDPDRFLPLIDGFCALARQHGVTLAGGDTCATPGPLVISVTIFGEAPQGTAVRRAGARAGDLVCVTGALGGSALGLALLDGADGTENVAEADKAELICRHLAPEPRLEAGRILREAGARAMIDVSDGLLQDLGHILEESGVGAVVDGDRLPLDAPLKAACAALGRDPLALAAGGGEDYELLCALPPEAAPGAERRLAAAGVALTRIGECRAGTGLAWRVNGRETPPPAAGYEHFASAAP